MCSTDRVSVYAARSTKLAPSERRSLNFGIACLQAPRRNPSPLDRQSSSSCGVPSSCGMNRSGIFRAELLRIPVPKVLDIGHAKKPRIFCKRVGCEVCELFWRQFSLHRCARVLQGSLNLRRRANLRRRFLSPALDEIFGAVSSAIR